MSDFHVPFWSAPDWVAEGDTVWLAKSHDYDSGKTRVVKCTVAVAAGNHARIVNSERDIDRWVSLNAALLVPPTDARHPNRRSERTSPSPTSTAAREQVQIEHHDHLGVDVHGLPLLGDTHGL